MLSDHHNLHAAFSYVSALLNLCLFTILHYFHAKSEKEIFRTKLNVVLMLSMFYWTTCDSRLSLLSSAFLGQLFLPLPKSY